MSDSARDRTSRLNPSRVGVVIVNCPRQQLRLFTRRHFEEQQRPAIPELSTGRDTQMNQSLQSECHLALEQLKSSAATSRHMRHALSET